MIIFYFILFIFGLAIGSFLNVLIIRLGGQEGEGIGGHAERGQSPAKLGGRSHCPKCGHILVWQDLIPVLSFILLKRRCRYCGEKISLQYPIVELATGILFVFIAAYVWNFESGILNLFGNFTLNGVEGWNLGIGNWIYFIYLLFIVSCLIVIFVSDLKYFIIPDEIVIAGVAGTLLYKIILSFDFASFGSGSKLCPGLVEGFMRFLPFLLSAAGACAFFLAIVLVTKGRGLGLGDAKLAFLMGLVLGWPKILFALLLAFVSGAIVGLGLIIAGRAKMKSQVPFGTFLSVATFLVIVWGGEIVEKYIDKLM